MSTTQLLKPILDARTRSPHFFNGRMLSAEDLRREHEANLEARKRLGKAVGEGVAYGLEVIKPEGAGSVINPVITVKAGLAVNRKGQTLSLDKDVDISLIPSTPPNTVPVVGDFSDCLPPQEGVYIAGSGVYILTLGPASGTEGRALVSELSNVEARCNRKYEVEGVQFRLLQIELTPRELGDENRLRNVVAYKCFGVAELETVLSNLFGPAVEKYGLLDTLRPRQLTDCEVPLAVFHWTTSGGIRFVDMWAVRRRLIESEADGKWQTLMNDRRRAEAEAMMLQFQEQIEEMRVNETSLAAIEAKQRFAYLPPVGIIPRSGGKSSRGFDYVRFFNNLTYREPVFIEGAKAEQFISTALMYTPINLQSKEMLWLYSVRENIRMIDHSTSTLPHAYLIFASGHMPFIGEARYDLSRWNYGNYA